MGSGQDVLSLGGFPFLQLGVSTRPSDSATNHWQSANLPGQVQSFERSGVLQVTRDSKMIQIEI